MSIDSRICAFLASRKAASDARKAAEAAKAKADMKIFDEVFEFKCQGLTEDQACHAVAHVRNISPRDVRNARWRVRWASKRDMERRIFANDWDEFSNSFAVTLILFFGCLFFMWFSTLK